MRYTVDSEQVRISAGTVRATAGKVQAEVAAMMGHLMTLKSSWQGQASVAFDDLTNRWRITQAQVERNLEEISRALEVAAVSYSDTEAAAARMFAG